MYRRRSPFGVFILLGVGVLLGAALFGGPGAVGGLVAAPFIVLGVMFKIVLFFMLFGLAARLLAGHGGRGRPGKNWCSPSQEWRFDAARPRRATRMGWPASDEGTAHDDRFEEWHRMAHARQEVDDHTPPVED